MSNGLFTSEDNPLAVLSRNLKNTGQSLADRGKRFYSNVEKLKEGEIGLQSFQTRVGGDLVGGAINDLIGFPVATAVDLAIPQSVADPVKKYASEVASEIAETGPAKAVLNYLDDNPETALNLQAVAQGVEAFIPFKLKAGINRAAFNTDTELPNFYSGNPLAKLQGVIEKGIGGVVRAGQVGLSPKYRALEREYGVSKGLVAQTDQFLNAVDQRPRLDAKVKAGETLTSSEAKTLALAKKGPSYQQGALAYAYLLNKQMGKETDFLNTAFGKEHVLKATKMDRQNFMSILPDVDDSIKNSFYSHAQRVWGFNPNKLDQTHVILKNPKSQTNMQAELFSSKGASDTGRFLYSLPLNPSDITDVPKMLDKFKTRKLKADERAIWEKAQSGKKLSDTQQSKLPDIQKKVDRTPSPRWSEADQTWYFSDSKISAAKELGGMNHWFALKSNGDLNIIASDKSDMFGLDPIGGDSLLVVFPPFKVNLFNRKFPEYNFSEGREGAMSVLESNYNTPVPVRSGRGFTQSTRQQAEAIRNLTPNVTASDRLGAAGTAAMAASVPASGMLTNYVEERQ
jgi:hypothetical protein